MIASISPDSALRASGRFIVTTSLWPSCSTRQCGGCRRHLRWSQGERSQKRERVLVLRVVALNIADLFEHAVDAAPDNPAVKVGDRVVDVRRAGARQQQAGALPGRPRGSSRATTSAIYAKNSVEHVDRRARDREDARGRRSTSTTATSRASSTTSSTTPTWWRCSSSAPTPPWSPSARPSTPSCTTFVVAARRHRARTTTPTSRRSAASRCDEALAGQSAERDFERAQRRRHPHHLHRRHHRLPEGRHVAPRGLLAGARRRHRLLHRRAAGGVRPVQAGQRPADDHLPAQPADARRRPGRPADAPVRRAPHGPRAEVRPAAHLGDHRDARRSS